MATERELALMRAMVALLSGQQESELPPEEPVYAWRLIRWEADVPLTDEQREALLEGVEETMAPAGIAAAMFARPKSTGTPCCGSAPMR